MCGLTTGLCFGGLQEFVRDPCEAGHDHAAGHPARAPSKGREWGAGVILRPSLDVDVDVNVCLARCPKLDSKNGTPRMNVGRFLVWRRRLLAWVRCLPCLLQYSMLVFLLCMLLRSLLCSLTPYYDLSTVRHLIPHSYPSIRPSVHAPVQPCIPPRHVLIRFISSCTSDTVHQLCYMACGLVGGRPRSVCDRRHGPEEGLGVPGKMPRSSSGLRPAFRLDRFRGGGPREGDANVGGRWPGCVGVSADLKRCRGARWSVAVGADPGLRGLAQGGGRTDVPAVSR